MSVQFPHKGATEELGNPVDLPRSEVTLGSRQRRLLSETIQVEDELIPTYAKPVLYLVIVMMFSFVVWAAVTQLAEVTSAPGEVIPSGQIKVVQHLSGGTVSEVMVEERMAVKEGDILIKLDDSRTLSDLRQIEGRLASLRLRAERQEAFVMGREPDFSSFEGRYPSMVMVQRQQLQNQISVRESTLDVLRQQTRQRESRLDQLEKSLDSAQQHRQLTEEMLEMRQGMAKKRLITRITLLETERAAVSARGEEERIIKEMNLIRQELAEAKSRYYETQNQILQDPLDQIDQLKAQIAETEEELSKVKSRLEELWVRAPASGLVFNLEVNNTGQVIQPGSVLMQIVPDHVQLQAEVRISPDDIGYVHPGQEVNLKVSSYDFSRFGYATGKLERVSAFSALDELNQPYFKGWVLLDKNYLGNDQGRFPLMPGMVVSAEILTGEKTLLAYLADPITKGLSSSFDER
ncbi:HlyD family type I secretion periplasmic adaptor subunit [Oceanospirillum sanctuarii]|uniref:HlyD family type I secretion periplasmic adaptor subunit n=1 Tax=Oceanospirillum sanctuarii TaxID=1434821 RepID=UPI000A3AE90B|nr:HlyD family type I secretion periplasmic adaptor subunit [Oceanospirillum sanctuarii]